MIRRLSSLSLLETSWLLGFFFFMDFFAASQRA
jgi:hypothetical protein